MGVGRPQARGAILAFGNVNTAFDHSGLDGHLRVAEIALEDGQSSAFA